MADFSRYGPASDEWLALEKSLPQIPPLRNDSILQARRAVNITRETLAAEGMKALQSQVHVKDYAIPTRDGETIEARTYCPKDEDKVLPLYIHLHGGGFLFGTLASEDATCSRITLNAQVIVLNVNYRHVPEYTYPTALNDTEDAFEWVHQNMEELGTDHQRIVIGGVSVGAQLAASLVLQKKLGRSAITVKYPELRGQILMIPCVVNMYCYEPQLKKLKHPSISSYEE